MKSIVMYESMFGNTEEVARAIAGGLKRCGDVELVEVGDATSPVGAVDLLVVGGPTHGFGMSRESTRADAQRQAGDTAVVSRRGGVREWAARLDGVRAGSLATFDTKARKARHLPGCARGLAKTLRRRGYTLVLPAESFLVEDIRGPLLDGELDRASRWGSVLGQRVGAAT
jgi:Flavodoxin